jgi:hypothetical protein
MKTTSMKTVKGELRLVQKMLSGSHKGAGDPGHRKMPLLPQEKSHSKEMNDDPPTTPLNMSGYTETNNHQI